MEEEELGWDRYEPLPLVSSLPRESCLPEWDGVGTDESGSPPNSVMYSTLPTASGLEDRELESLILWNGKWR